MPDVFLRLDDRDEGEWGVGIYFVSDPSEAQGRLYGPSEEAAFHNARMATDVWGWKVIDEPENLDA